jgi:CDP-glycerol glycerophosphotransferase
LSSRSSRPRRSQRRLITSADQGRYQGLISFVIPVYGVRAYLTECLDSVLGQESGSALEVIAVDDASVDGSGALLDERASLDDRLTVIHLDQSGGPGNARNTGLARATGEYVWFVDGDDALADGAIDVIRARLAAVTPDVLLIDYLDWFPDGTLGASTGAELLRSVPKAEFALADAPQVINLTMTGWSKLFRSEFLVELGEPFRAGIHEDVPVTCAALLAGRLAALDRPCYRYRRARPGSFMVTTTSKHRAIFSAYEEVFDLLEKHIPAVTPQVQAAVFERAIWHYASVLATAGLVPKAERRKFFERMHADYVRYEPDHYALPSGARGAKFRLIKQDSYVTYELLEPVNRVRVALRRYLHIAHPK